MTENSRKLKASIQMPANENPQTTFAAAERCSFLVDSAVDAVESATKMRAKFMERSPAFVNMIFLDAHPSDHEDSVRALIAFSMQEAAACGVTDYIWLTGIQILQLL